MQALGFRSHGNLDVMEILDLPIPKPGYGEVLLEVKASAFNHLDIWVREGWPGLQLHMPHISGSDAAGIIVELGKGVTDVKPGQRVAVNPGINLWEDEFTARGEHSESPGYRILGEHLPGCHAQFITVPAKNCLTLPEHISFAMAAATGLVGTTAWRMLVHRAKMRMGERLLIIGAGGGVNSMAIQLAKNAGCEVYALTSSAEKMERARALGADVVINYRDNPQWIKELQQLTHKQGFDIVVDNVGQASLAASMKLVKRGGRIVIVGNTSGPFTQIDIRYIFSKQISLIGSTMGNSDDYRHIMLQMFNGKVKPAIHCTLPLAEGIAAMRLLAEGKQFGKIVLIN